MEDTRCVFCRHISTVPPELDCSPPRLTPESGCSLVPLPDAKVVLSAADFQNLLRLNPKGRGR